MLARPEWNEPEKREPTCPHAEAGGFRVFLGCLGIAMMLWLAVIFPLLNAFHRSSVAHHMARLEVRLR